MKTAKLIFALLCIVSFQAKAANLAIIDSGVDYKHEALAGKIWNNSNNPVQTTDDDGTVYQDDVRGWNFADKNNEVIDYKYLGTFSPDCTKLFEVQGRILLGTATAEDKAWYQSKKNDQNFIKELEKFGNFVHGTHVSGIASHNVDKAKIIAMKIIPTETPGSRSVATLVRSWLSTHHLRDGADDPMVKMILGFVAQQQASMLTTVGKYTKAVKSDVANGSFGISVKSAEPIVANLLKQFLKKDPTPEETKAYTVYLINQIIDQSKTFVSSAPDTLFVFAAGNDGTDNDAMPASPANIKTDNTISVAATQGVRSLASFSNFGATMVDVAAPGVVIRSSIPGNQYLSLSGTSMAAPFVTNVAGAVKDANPSLTPAEIKQVLMGTVDTKSYLSGKVSTSGIVNPNRATHAADLAASHGMTLEAAIAQAKTDVPDMPDTYFSVPDEKDLIVLPLPSPLQ